MGLLFNLDISETSHSDAWPSTLCKPPILRKLQKHVASYHDQTKFLACGEANTWEPLPYECQLLSSDDQVRQQKLQAELRDLLSAWR